MVCGFAAFALSNFERKAITALIVGGVAGVLMIICAAMANNLLRNRTVGMIGIHAGLVLPAVFALLFGWRAMSAYQAYQLGTRPLHLFTVLLVMAIGSAIAFVLVLRSRPAMDERRA